MAEFYPLFPIFAAICFVLVLLPFHGHLHAWNVGTCSYIVWVAASCLIMFTDSIIWNGNTKNVPIWCDIVAKWVIGSSVGIPAASLCIVRRLHKMTTIKTVSLSFRNKRSLLCDLAITVGLPVMVMILHVIVQGHRYDILEDFGCFPITVNTAAAYPLVYIWPILLGCIAFVYAGLAFRAFWKRRTEFSQLLSSTPSLSVDRYLRLMILACTEMVCTIPLGAYSLYIGTYGVPLEPYISWENIHWGFNRYDVIPAQLWQSSRILHISIESSRWIYIACALIFIALFGFTEEARKNYSRAVWRCASVVGFKQDKGTQAANLTSRFRRGNGSSNNALPVYTPAKLDPTILAPSSPGSAAYLERALPSQVVYQPHSATSSSSTVAVVVNTRI